MSAAQQWVAQVAAAAVCGTALGKLLVELARGGVAIARRRFGSRGEVRG